MLIETREEKKNKKIKADYSSENHHNLFLFEIVINCLTSMWVTYF